MWNGLLDAKVRPLEKFEAHLLIILLSSNEKTKIIEDAMQQFICKVITKRLQLYQEFIAP